MLAFEGSIELAEISSIAPILGTQTTCLNLYEIFD